MSNKKFAELSERINFILQDTGLTQRQMADRLKCSTAHINQMKQGKRAVIGDSLAQHISDVYGYRYDWIKHGDGPIYVEATKKKLAPKLSEFENRVEEKIAYLEQEVYLLRELLKQRRKGQ